MKLGLTYRSYTFILTLIVLSGCAIQHRLDERAAEVQQTRAAMTRTQAAFASQAEEQYSSTL